MPPASSRRSGTAHTSKAAKRSRQDGGPEEASSSSAMVDAELSSSQQRQDEGTTEDSVDRINKLLEQFDRNPEPLTLDTSDAGLRSLRSDWSGMEANFDIAFQLISDVAERLADARAAEGLIEEDDTLQELDIGIRGMIDLHEEVKHRKLALEEIRNEVTKGEEVRDAAGMYRNRTKQLEDDYTQKTTRQKYIQSDVYRRYKTAVWGALREDDMPPLGDLLPYEANDEGDDDDDVVAFGGDKQKYKCPLSLKIMEEPLRSAVCPHSYEKKSILDYLQNATKTCPSCNKSINKNTLKEDPKFTSACHKSARREQIRKETQRTQAQATMLD